MKDLETLSDEELMNTPPPVVDPEDAANALATANEAQTPQGGEEDSAGEEANTPPEQDEQVGDAEDKKPEDDATAGGGEADDQAGKASDDKASVEGDTDAAKPASEAPDKNTPPVEGANTPVVDPKTEYEKILAPFNANGKPMQVKNADEAIRLMQMGANYSRKMQDIQPHRKVLRMLQDNQLLDENRLSFLIDLEKKNPEAIKKLIADSGIDPLEIDMTVAPAYREGTHRVSDEEESFRSVLDEVTSSVTGKETVQLVHTTWDQLSKDALWANPEILKTIQQQRENGIYDRIVSELDRQRALGDIPVSTPFLKAYEQVGKQLVASGGFQDLAQTPGNAANQQQGQGQPQPQKQVVDTRVAQPKPVTSNSEQARAASPTRSTPGTAKPLINPLAMSDAEFLALSPPS
jgi:hypothetical protein